MRPENRLQQTLVLLLLTSHCLAQQAGCAAIGDATQDGNDGDVADHSSPDAHGKGKGDGKGKGGGTDRPTLGGVALQHELENCTAFDADGSSTRLWLNPNHLVSPDGRQAFPINMSMRIFSGSTDISYSEASSQMVVRFEAAIITSWYDPRLSGAACAHIMSQMLTSEGERGFDSLWPGVKPLL